ncbi:MAG: valine--tRNA ligase, partial [Proteobacteria bacterium]|nr:valine--tRNA ligase [Pseudomonadota bacterium]
MITEQIRRLGASCDWSRERFTLDEGLTQAVREAFVRLYEKGLIYRGPRLINWSPGLKTAVSDLEVEYSEEPGKLYYFKYVIKGLGTRDQGLGIRDQEFIPVATTRPETILGDTAVAVHPEDDRYKKFIGKMAVVPILGREIPVIADEYVDREFGTGALKITPGHDPNDYEIGQRHGLELISVLDKAARVNIHGGPYQGQDRFEARANLWEDMRAAGLVIKEEEYIHQIPRSQRGGEIIEPMVSTQWFVNIKPLAEAAIQSVRDGRIKIVPARFEKVYFNWMENIRDWCISRQLWWGHRIPVWYCDDCGEITVAREDPSECAHCGSPNIKQDPDVVDTWFSSGLWPFSTLGWPDETPDLAYFYPTTMMETGYDILFFWVARMIMMGLEFTGEVPFSEIYLHGLIRDESGKKMSKSYGNVIDPLVVMDEMGTDALRFTLLVSSTPGNDMNLSLKKVEANRNFANKLWNGTRFVLWAIGTLGNGKLGIGKLGNGKLGNGKLGIGKLGNGRLVYQDTEPIYQYTSIPNTNIPTTSIPNTNFPTTNLPAYTLADSWIWARLQSLIRDVDRLFSNHQYGEAGRQIYDFFWNEFADWYVEIAKLQIASGGERAFVTTRTLVKVLDLSLRLLHPFIPFVTEELWQHLRHSTLNSPLSALASDWPDALIIAPYPEPRQEQDWEAEKTANFESIKEIVRSIRNLRAEKNVKPGTRIPAIFAAGEMTSLIESQAATIASLAKLDESQISILQSLDEKPEGHVALVVGPVEIYLPLSKLVDVAEERARLEKELVEADGQIQRLEKLLASPFAEKAPPTVADKERDRLAGFKETAQKLKGQMEGMT